MPRNKDALKFFQNFLFEMIDIGGENLPKSIATSLGAKLGKILKERGYFGIESSLRRLYSVLNAKTRIKTIDDKTLDITLKYSKKFCPIGGKFNPNKAEMLQNTICIPYTAAILNSLHPEFRYSSKIVDCILNSKENHCRYILTKELKTSNQINQLRDK